MKLPLTLSLDKDGLPRIFSDPAAAIQDHAHDSSGELFLVELQGQLEVQLEEKHQQDSADAAIHAGHRIGRLDMSVPSRPTLLIGHHRLIGQIAKLNTPLAILKHSLPPRTSSSTPGPPPTSSPLHPRHNLPSPAHSHAASSPLKRTRSQSPEEGKDGPTSDSTSKRTMLEPPSSNEEDNQEEMRKATPTTPFASLLAKPAAASDNVAMPLQASSPFLDAPPSSALTARTPAPRTPFNVSEVRSGTHEIVGIIRSKILFSKRPEPVVKLDEQSEEE